MIIKKASLLGSVLIAVRNGKTIKDVVKLDTEHKTVRSVTGRMYQADYFVAYKPTAFMHNKLRALGIEWTRDIKAYIRKRKLLLQESKKEETETAASTDKSQDNKEAA